VGSGAGTAAPRPETRGFDEVTRALASARGVTRCQRPARSSFHIIWNKARRQAGVAHLHLHDLRHTGNTLAAETGATLRELMDRMGHRSTRVALIYLHARDQRDRAIADGLDTLVATTPRHPTDRE